MTRTFLVLFLCILGLYAGLELTLERRRPRDVVRLRWATDDNPARREQIAAFNALHPGIELTIDLGDYNKRIVQCATRTGPDILDIYGVGDMVTYVQAGILLNLGLYADSLGFGLGKTYPAIAGALALDDGTGMNQYRFPCNVWADGVIYNKRIFDELGIPYPVSGWTYDDLIATGKLIRERSGGAIIALANSGVGANVWYYKNLLIGHGGRFFAPDGLSCRFGSEQSCAAARLYYEILHVHKITPTPSEAAALSSQGGWGAGGFSWFCSGKAAMVVAGRWFSVVVRNYPDLAGEIAAVTLPRVGALPSAGMVDARAAGINRLTAHKKEALAFLRYLASEEYAHGIATDGDALPPLAGLYTTGEDLASVNTINSPEFHQVFLDAMVNARPIDYSPFMDAGPTERWLKERLDGIDNINPRQPQTTPEEIMRGLQREVDRQIRINIERRPELQRRYREITGKEWKS